MLLKGVRWFDLRSFRRQELELHFEEQEGAAVRIWAFQKLRVEIWAFQKLRVEIWVFQKLRGTRKKRARPR